MAMEPEPGERDLITIVEEIQATKAQTHSNDNDSSIEIIENNEKFQVVKFTEGSKENILMYNVLTGQLYADGYEITVHDIPVPDYNIDPNALMNPFDHQYKDVQLAQKIISYTQDALGAIIAWSLATPTPLGIYIASEYINRAMGTVKLAMRTCLNAWTIVTHFIINIGTCIGIRDILII